MAAEAVAVEEGRPALARGLGGQAEAEVELARVEGRGRGHDEEVGARVEEVLHRVDGIAEAGDRRLLPPDVLADRDADAAAAELEYPPLAGGLEVARLVEDVVGGEEGLGLGEDEGPARDHGDRADEGPALPRAVPVDVAHRDRDLGRELALEAAQGGEAALDEGVLVEEVHRRIAAEGELGEDDELGAAAGLAVGPDRVARAPREGEDALPVAVEIADDGVHLREGDEHS